MYTTTLDLIERMCAGNAWVTLRLDGSTDVAARTGLVDRFNRPPMAGHEDSAPFVFLLSSKAGGVGLNLIGGNRLVMYDCDWNPATDRQAMARVWRTGQKKDVTIYRFFAAGTIDEKILQRQMLKEGVAEQLVGGCVLLVRAG